MEHIHQKLAVSNRVGVVLRIIQMRDQIDANMSEENAASARDYVNRTPEQTSER